MLGSDVRGLVDRGNQSVHAGDVDDASPLSLLHAGQGVAGGVEGRAEVERNHFLPDLFGELLHLADVLHSRVVHQDVHLSEVRDRFLHQSAAVSGLSEIREDELGL